ncbi:MAG: hypothetical protein M9899_10290 [Bdellovibrionaceae bacterium]|nr:hypothetical protein [Pseudobdellovibrionaceae bacterium]
MKRIILFLMVMAIAPVGMAQMYNANMYGTGLSAAYPPCSYEQTSIAGKVTKKSERFEAAAAKVRRELKSIQKKLDKLSTDNSISSCERVVSAAVRGYCATGSSDNEKRISGSKAWNDFKNHMTGSPVFVGAGMSFTQEYLYTMNGLYKELGMQNPYRMLASADGGGPADATPLTPGFQSCDNYAASGGGIDSTLCEAAARGGHIAQNAYEQCDGCLRATPSNPRGRYPSLVREVYELQQKEAQYKKDLEIAEAKVACAQSYIDGEMANKNSEFRECILDADEYATAADYCLTCDESGKEKKSSGVEWSKWLPGLLTAGLWTAGGIFAYNQMEKTREGNWEAGYPSDDRQPWVMTNYVMNGASQVIDTFKASGAFGCAPTGGLNGQGVLGATNVGPYGQYQFNGSPFLNVGGALGYPQNMIVGPNGQLMVGGGLYANNPMGMHAGGNLQAQQAALQQQQLILQNAIAQGNRDLATLQAVAQLDVQLAQINAQRQQIFASNPGFGTSYGTYGAYGTYGTSAYGGGTSLFGSIQGNISIGAVGSYGAYGTTYGTPYGTTYGASYGYPVVPPYTGATVPTTGTTVPSTGTTVPSTGGNTGNAVPSLGL